jgi:hypothetical protein
MVPQQGIGDNTSNNSWTIAGDWRKERRERRRSHRRAITWPFSPIGHKLPLGEGGKRGPELINFKPMPSKNAYLTGEGSTMGGAQPEALSRLSSLTERRR